MNDLQTFNFDDLSVRTLEIENEVYFVGKDVAEILGYQKPSNAIANHVDDEDKTTSLIQGTGSNYKSTTTLINESGLYALIFSSKLETSKRFKRWVTSEVLPQIRKTGKYEVQSRLPGTYKEALLQLVEQVEVNEKLQLENSVQKQQIGELKPKGTYYDLVLQNKTLLSVSKIAKDYGMSAQALNKLLKDLKVQYKQGDIWLLYAKYQDKGYTQTSTHVIDDEKSKISTKWTQAGRLFIYDLLKDNGILPVIERESA